MTAAFKVILFFLIIDMIFKHISVPNSVYKNMENHLIQVSICWVLVIYPSTGTHVGKKEEQEEQKLNDRITTFKELLI